jgi:phospholipid-translocating ATPase
MCRDAGLAYFIERDSNMIKICVKGIIEIYEILRVLEFDSDRKRMSVIVRRESDGKIINFMKGADMVII